MAQAAIIAIIGGVIVGILSGLFGIGGGTFVIPLMRVGFGVPGLTATGTSLFTIIFTSISGVLGRSRSETVSVKMGVMFGLGGVVFSPLGSLFSNYLGGFIAIILASLFILFVALNHIRKGFNMRRASVEEEPVEFVDINSIELNAKNVAKGIAIGAIGGFCSGLLGVGGGFIITPLSLWIFHISLKDAQGTSLLAILFLSIPGAITRGFLGEIDYIRGLAIAIGSIPGAQIGARLSEKVPEQTMRFVFGGFLILMSVMLFVNELIS